MSLSNTKTPRRDFLRAVAASPLLAASYRFSSAADDDASGEFPALKSADDAPKFVAAIPVWAQGRE